jgi:hypothetical protein
MRGITGAGGTQSNSGQLAFYTNDNGTYAERLRIASSGAATFSNQVTMNGPSADWAAIIQNTNSGAGTSYGLKVKAGTSGAADATFVLQDYAGNEFLTARGNGRIGIGTNSPAYTLDVNGKGKFGSNSINGDVIIQSNTGLIVAPSLGFNTNATLGTSVGTRAMTITSGGNVAMNNNLAVGRAEEGGVRLSVTTSTNGSDAYGVIVRQLSGQDLFVVRNDGLWITGNRSLSPYNNSISGRTIVADSSGTLGYTSSTRESKINIEKLNDVSWLYQLNPVSFNYRKKDNEINYTDEAQDDKWYGLIADEVEKVNEDLVFYNIKEDGTKQLAGVEYNKLIAALIKSSQEQQAQIEELKAKILSL